MSKSEKPKMKRYENLPPKLNIISVFPRTLPGNVLLPWLTENHAEDKLTLCEADFFLFNFWILVILFDKDSKP